MNCLKAAVITRFFSHIRDVKPTVMATFNGDFFDFPFLFARAQVNGIDMFLETGFAKDSEETRFLPTTRQPRFEGGDYRETWVQPHRA